LRRLDDRPTWPIWLDQIAACDARDKRPTESEAMSNVTFMSEDARRIIPQMIEEELDAHQRARYQRALDVFDCEYALWGAGMGWNEANAEATHCYPSLGDKADA
jgi:hypothetical protein